MEKRGSGVLLHISSLTSPYGIGDFGPDAYEFADFLAGTRQKFWQILPLTLTCPSYGNSPYSSYSTFAGNHLLISPERLVRDGYLSESDIQDAPAFSKERVDYKAVTEYKNKIFSMAYEKNRDRLANLQEFQRFCSEHSCWLNDFSLFISIKNYLKGSEWSKWPEDLRDRKKEALTELREKLGDEILREKFLQYIFFNQWYSLKNYCDSKDIKLIGDIPIYVNYDSSDVWANPGIFSLDKEKKPVFVAGVPPDYFSSTGQLWGHPVYKWDVLKESRYSWWIKRIEHNLKLFHMFRLDHFRGFVGYWQVRSNEKTAINGKWVEAPAEDFFTELLKHFPGISIIAEDLGVITPDVREIINKFGFPGMKVLLFAFGEDLPTNPYAPHNHIKHCVVYTGTHDNNTITGWYKTELTPEDRNRISRYIGKEISDRTIHWELIRLAMMSVADTVIIPMQDILGLGEKDRMNLPASPRGNWEWRLAPQQLSNSLIKKIKEMTLIYGRG
ncbi:MAG TPA: 4-alpha-glucanotransferase [Nitrospirae bacterium]|nr:4-alpha-glucanotransferase [bacterium BMS3Abin06]HDH10670.1 4-alpha-glucanotransferase [Nitrospirota bacterium]HDZ01500.1 4-alpha-glucanotransferase [Nitrospirota bacterium]